GRARIRAPTGPDRHCPGAGVGGGARARARRRALSPGDRPPRRRDTGDARGAAAVVVDRRGNRRGRGGQRQNPAGTGPGRARRLRRLLGGAVTRDATVADADELCRLLTQLGYPTTPARIAATLPAASRDRGAVVIAESDNGGLAGFVAYQIVYFFEDAAPRC